MIDKIETFKNISQLNISLNELYRAKKQINIHVEKSPYVFSLVLLSRNKIDCKISSFGANLWMRTNKGINYEKYKSLGVFAKCNKKKN